MQMPVLALILKALDKKEKIHTILVIERKWDKSHSSPAGHTLGVSLSCSNSENKCHELR